MLKIIKTDVIITNIKTTLQRELKQKSHNARFQLLELYIPFFFFFCKSLLQLDKNCSLPFSYFKKWTEKLFFFCLNDLNDPSIWSIDV